MADESLHQPQHARVLDVEGTVKKILTTEYVQEQLEGSQGLRGCERVIRLRRPV